MSSGEEVAHALIDVSVNTAECRSARPVAEVVRPAKQRPVQRVAHSGPRIVVAGHQQIAILCLEPLHALLGRACAQIPKTVRFVTVWSERVAEEVEAFLPNIPQRGLGLVECQPEPRHHRLRPRQRFGRTSATEDDEVVGIRDDVCTECFPAPGQPPVLQEPVHVDVGEQWTRDAALGRAARVALATADAPGPFGPAHRRDAKYPRGEPCRRASRSGRQAPPSPYDTAFSEGSGSLSVLPGSSPITFTSPSSKAHQKPGPFPPPALPGFNGRMTLSDSRQSRRLSATLRPLSSLTTGLPRLLGSPFRRAVPTTPADQAGAHVDCFPVHAAFPKWQEGRHPHCHFRGLLRLHTRYGPPDRSAALG